MARADMRDIAHRCTKTAVKKGAKEAAATVSRVREVTLEWRDGRVDRINEATRRGVQLQLYVDGRYSMASSSDLRPEALERFIADSVSNTRVLAEDPFRSLPDPALRGRMYRTGDLGRWSAEGPLEFLGRGDKKGSIKNRK